MAETVSLCLSYITESSNESLKSFDSGLTAADDAINLLKANTTNGSIEAADVSSLTYCSPVRWIEILSSVYMDKQDQSTNMDMKPVARETKKARSVTSSHTVERGESSGTHASIVKSTEAAGKVNSNRKVDVGQRSDQTHRQEGFYGDLGTGDDIELEIMIKRAFRLSVTDGLQEFTRFTVAETQYMNKGKEPIRPTVTETSSFAACISRNKEGNVQSNNNNRRPLRSALKKDSISLTRLTAKRQSSTQSTESDQSAAKTVVQFDSHEGNSQARLHKSENKRTEIDGSWKSNHNQSDDGNSQDTTSDEENQDYNNGELREQLDIIVKRNPSSAITVRPYTNTMTGQEVFLFNHGIVIPRKDTSKLIYGVAIPGKIFRQKKNRYSSTFTFLVALSKANLDILDIGTAKSDLIRTLILDDAEEAYRKSKYGDYTWVGITKERKHRYDPDTRSWLSLFYPSQWPRHGLVLSEGQNPPENSCKFRMISLCGKVLYQWYVRCEPRKSFGPRNIIARLSCGEDGTCEKLLNWDPESGPMIHNDSVKRWTEIDPNREGVDLPDMFYPFMKFWIIEGPPREEPPPGCMKINCVTRCGLVKSKIHLLCPRHISKKPKCMGGQFTMLIDRGCALRDDIGRCDEKTACDGYLAWLDDRLGLPLDKLTVKQANDLDRLHTTIVSAYNKETRRMGSFLKHKNSEKKWRDVIYNHVEYYDMLFKWGLRSIEYPESLSVAPADESVLKG